MSAHHTSRGRSAGNKLTALILWGFSCYATYEFLKSLAGAGSIQSAAIVAVVIQAALTFGESPLWRGEVTLVGAASLVIDTFTNVGGMFYFIGNLEKSESWRAFATTVGASGDVSGYTQLFLAIVGGILLAAAPEALWKQM